MTDPVTITRHFELDAGHRLAEHNFKCQNVHGHRYIYDIEVTGTPDPTLGYVIDFSNLKSPIMDAFDHNLLLNAADPLLDAGVIDAIEAEQAKTVYQMECEPTVENIAHESVGLIWESMRPTERHNVTEIVIHVAETPNCTVTLTVESEPGSDTYHVSP